MIARALSGTRLSKSALQQIRASLLYELQHVKELADIAFAYLDREFDMDLFEENLLKQIGTIHRIPYATRLVLEAEKTDEDVTTWLDALTCRWVPHREDHDLDFDKIDLEQQYKMALTEYFGWAFCWWRRWHCVRSKCTFPDTAQSWRSYQCTCSAQSRTCNVALKLADVSAAYKRSRKRRRKLV